MGLRTAALKKAQRLQYALWMQVFDFINHFERRGAGVWHCRHPATLHLPTGRIQVAAGTLFTVGTTFMGIDLAALLEEAYERYIERPWTRPPGSCD